MFGLMYLNTYEMSHLEFSETRFYMAFFMGAVMAAIMLLFMLNMYTSTAKNSAILVTCVIVFSGALWLVRSQHTRGEVSWMKAMIPHHSIAILTSSRANITDPRVKDLANRIIEAQKKEIDEMKALIEDLSQ